MAVPMAARSRRRMWIAASAVGIAVGIVVASAIAVYLLVAPPDQISAGPGPDALAVTPNGRTLYVADGGSGGFPSHNGDTVTPVNVATGRPATPIRVGNQQQAMSVPPDRRH